MATRLVHLTIDAADPVRIATFWAQALGWITVVQEAEEVVAQPAGFDYPGAMALPLAFVPVTEPKTVKNRVHWDLASTSLEDQAAQVDRLIELAATRIDLRRGEAGRHWCGRRRVDRVGRSRKPRVLHTLTTLTPDVRCRRDPRGRDNGLVACWRGLARPARYAVLLAGALPALGFPAPNIEFA